MAAIDNIFIQQTDVSEDIELFFKTNSVAESDSHHDLLKKIEAIDKFSQFFKQNLEFNTLENKNEKHRYIRFMSRLIEARENLELAAGKTSLQEIKLAGRSFARKTQDPIGIY
jgi:hypothetical protein